MPNKPNRSNNENVIFEKRKFVRMDATFVVSYKAVDTPRHDVSQTRNISMGGILFTTDRKFKPGTVLELKLRLPEKEDYLIVKSKVVNSKEKARNIVNETGVKFIDLSEKDKAIIFKIIEHRLRGGE